MFCPVAVMTSFKHPLTLLPYIYTKEKSLYNINLGENIADGGGIHQAYRTYKRWLNQQQKSNPKVLENEMLPELNLTSTQLFFLSFGQVWCGDIRREASKNKMISAVQHSPARFRVLGALSNFAEFSKEFKCPVNSPMNPAHKCKVW